MGLKQEQKKLEQNYEQEIMDILVLLGDMGGGAGGVTKGIWEPSVDMLAYIDLSTQELVKCKGWIYWLAEEKDRNGWIYHLENEKIYHLKVRKRKQEKQNLANHVFLLVEVVERDLDYPELNKILEEYQKPMVIKDELCGAFSLERKFEWFAGTIDWLGDKCSAMLECDKEDAEEGKETAEHALHTLHIIYKDLKKWDEKFRKFAAEQLTELANDWLMDSEDFDEDNEYEDDESENLITKEAFAERIRIGEITISPDGDYEVYYNDDDMFWGHVIIVSGNIETGIEDAQIAG
ncbi:MAG: DUF2262 domain-containing protein [Lachnospiraceae bacterium]|nr:DUF2262 domain-containing protein [Lachnospiraceae bacterium]